MMSKRTDHFLEQISLDARTFIETRRHLSEEDREAIMILFYGIQREISFELVKRDLIEEDFFERVKGYIDKKFHTSTDPA